MGLAGAEGGRGGDNAERMPVCHGGDQAHTPGLLMKARWRGSWFGFSGGREKETGRRWKKVVCVCVCVFQGGVERVEGKPLREGEEEVR